MRRPSRGYATALTAFRCAGLPQRCCRRQTPIVCASAALWVKVHGRGATRSPYAVAGRVRSARAAGSPVPCAGLSRRTDRSCRSRCPRLPRPRWCSAPSPAVPWSTPGFAPLRQMVEWCARDHGERKEISSLHAGRDLHSGRYRFSSGRRASACHPSCLSPVSPRTRQDRMSDPGKRAGRVPRPTPRTTPRMGAPPGSGMAALPVRSGNPPGDAESQPSPQRHPGREVSSSPCRLESSS